MTSLVFIDSRVTGFNDTLLNLGADVRVVLLDAQSDGIEQILNALQGVTDLSAIHIVSHGSSGTLYLGSTVLTEASLNDYGTGLAKIGSALAPQGDVMLYGCDVAAGDAGQHFIQSLAQLTGADVAASTDLTGAAALGGDWVLEANAGVIEAQVLAPVDFAALLAAPVVTSAGTLDTSFDTDGSLVTDFGAAGAIATSVALQVDGKIVAAGFNVNGTNHEFALARYNADGSLDTTFDTDGKLTTAFGADSAATGAALQSDGKIVVAGFTSDGVTYDFALARYNGTDGSLDTTFSGDGKATVVFGGVDNSARAVTLQTDGKIVVAGYAYNGASYDFALARYDTNGNADAAFSGDGKQTTSFGAGDDFINSIALQSDGKIVAAGYSYNGTNNDFALARYNTDGSLDTTFDTDGKVTTDFGGAGDIANSVALQTDGKIVVAGYSFNGTNYDFALARYNVNGSLDTTFDGDGKVTTAFGTGNDVAFSVALQADGKIVVAGDFKETNRDFALARYNSDGSLDTTFRGDGKLDIAIGVSAGATSMVLQADGSIVAAGSGLAGGNTDFALVRALGGPGIPDIATKQGAALNFAFNANTFSDPDGDVLSYAATLANGAALPAWLHFDAGTRTFSGTPSLGNVGSLSVKVTATDTTAASTSDVFNVAVTNLSATTGDDLLYGGTGADTMTGLQGNDTYIVDNPGDVVVEAPTQGTDTILSSINYALPANVENLTLTGANSTNGTGNELGNVLTGNSGNNVLDGGLGVDTAVYSAARGGYVITKAGLYVTITGPDGIDTLTGIERAQFTDGTFKLVGAPLTDFNSDGKSDLVLHNTTTGMIEMVQMNGTSYTGYRDYAYPSNWHPVSTQADFNADGKSDFVSRDSATGALEVLQMDGVNYSAYRDYAYTTNWQPVDARADFNGDGKNDLVMRDSNTGTLELVQMDGVNYSAYRDIAYPSNWQPVEMTADFNGDGKSDIVMRDSSTGTIELLQMNGVNYTAYRDIAYPSNWQPVEMKADFNGDGKSDIVMRDSTTGTLEVLQMDGVNYTSYRDYAYTANWQPVDMKADFNGDGKSDIVMRDSTTGTIEVLQMDGVNYTAYRDYAYTANWQVVNAKGDFNGDGKNDLVMRDGNTGTIEVLQMDGVNYSAYRDYAYPSNWQPVDTQTDVNGDGKTDLTMRNSTTGTVEVLQMDGVNYTGYQDIAYNTDWHPVVGT